MSLSWIQIRILDGLMTIATKQKFVITNGKLNKCIELYIVRRAKQIIQYVWLNSVTPFSKWIGRPKTLWIFCYTWTPDQMTYHNNRLKPISIDQFVEFVCCSGFSISHSIVCMTASALFYMSIENEKAISRHQTQIWNLSGNNQIIIRSWLVECNRW